MCVYTNTDSNGSSACSLKQNYVYKHPKGFQDELCFHCGLKSLTHLFSPNIHWVVKIHAIDVTWHEGEYLLCVNEESLNIQWTF